VTILSDCLAYAPERDPSFLPVSHFVNEVELGMVISIDVGVYTLSEFQRSLSSTVSCAAYGLTQRAHRTVTMPINKSSRLCSHGNSTANTRATSWLTARRPRSGDGLICTNGC